MSRFPSSESSSGSPSMGGRLPLPLPLSEASSGSPPLGIFLPSESSSGSPPLLHFRFEAGGGTGSSRHLSSASRTTSQHCSPEAPARDRSLNKLPPKPPRFMRTPRPFGSRMEKAEKAETHQEYRKMAGCSSNDQESVPADRQPNSSLKIIIRWSGKKPGGSDNAAAAEEQDCGGESQKGEEEAKVEEEEKVEAAEEKFEDLVEKKWNLRPRKPIKKAGAGAGKEPQLQEGSSSQKAAAPKKKPAAPKKPKPSLKLSIALTRREIEEDLYAMTGSRPSRKPKRRSKQLQNIVNHLSPGFKLQSFSPSSYNTKG